MASFPSLRQIFAAFRSPEQEADLSRTAFSRFLLFILSVTSISLLASKAIQKIIDHFFLLKKKTCKLSTLSLISIPNLNDDLLLFIQRSQQNGC
ncbi:hypothetical protein PSHT_00507 [Puccinia striiformis]|uniref:Uncharacterized protein n=1 Tax=Puccinia striiformis TaxID=27350 RepID=A0A2S4WMP7_9BASI|nr:hypothetical protein PSHT_00507 [Puccinia striiformis]